MYQTIVLYILLYIHITHIHIYIYIYLLVYVEAATKQLKFTGNLDGLWEELVAEDEEVLLLQRLEPAIPEAKASFIDACADRYGSVERAFLEMYLPEKPLMSHEA